MILAFDTYYFDNRAKTVCLSFDDWDATHPAAFYTEIHEGIAEYVPGQFYKRELPCILSLLQQVSLVDVEAIIVDGYVYLDDEQKPGLGYYLHEALQHNIPVIGVAKSNFTTLNKFKLPLLRGDSANPLFITSVGTELQIAADNIAAMAGPYRIPALLKMLDMETKSIQ